MIDSAPMIEGLRRRAEYADYHTDEDFLNAVASHIEQQDEYLVLLKKAVDDIATMDEAIANADPTVAIRIAGVVRRYLLTKP
jgi:hypothetical protein